MINNYGKKDIVFVFILILSVYAFSNPAFYLYLNTSHNNYNEISSMLDLEHSYPHRHFFNLLVYVVKFFFFNNISLETSHIILINISVILSIVLIYLIIKPINTKYAFWTAGSIVLTYPFIGSLAFPVHQDILVILFSLSAFYFIKRNIILCNVFIFFALLTHELALFSIPILFYLQLANKNNSKKKNISFYICKYNPLCFMVAIHTWWNCKFF